MSDVDPHSSDPDPVSSLYENEHADDYMWQLEANFAEALWRFIVDNPYGVELLSGYRSVEHQQRLWDQAVARYGPEEAPKWAARPGQSNHNRGLAGDLHFLNERARKWAHEHAGDYGLHFPMGHEPWHVEPLGVNHNQYQDLQVPDEDLYHAYTFPPPGTPHATDPIPVTAERSLALMDNIMRGPLPPANAIEDAGAALVGPSAMMEEDPLTTGPSALSEPQGDFDVDSG